MVLTVNGKAIEYNGTSLKGLIEHLGLDASSVVVELNGTVVHRQDIASASVNQGDSIELVRFVGGG